MIRLAVMMYIRYPINHRMEVGRQYGCNFHEFNHIKPPLSVLIFGDEELRLTKCIGHRLLSHAGRFPSLDETLN